MHRHNPVTGSVSVFLYGRSILSQHYTSAKPTIQASLVHHDGVLYVIPTVRHDSNSCVLARPELVEVDQVQDLCLHEGFLRIHEEVQQSVHPLVLVVGHASHGLFSHGTLVGISRRLIVVRVWNQPSTNSQDGEWFYLQMRSLLIKVTLPESNEAIILLIHIKILDQSHRQ